MLRRKLEDHHKQLKDLNKSLENLKLQVVKAEVRAQVIDWIQPLV